MRNEMYMHRVDAIRHAEEYAMNNDGWVLDELAFVTNNNQFDWVDRELVNVVWGGETNAYQVVDKSGNLVALFGFLL